MTHSLKFGSTLCFYSRGHGRRNDVARLAFYHGDDTDDRVCVTIFGHNVHDGTGIQRPRSVPLLKVSYPGEPGIDHWVVTPEDDEADKKRRALEAEKAKAKSDSKKALTV